MSTNRPAGNSAPLQPAGQGDNRQWGNPYISVNSNDEGGERTGENASRGGLFGVRVKLAAKMINTAELMRTRLHRP